MFKMTIEGTTIPELASAIAALALQFQTTGTADVDKPAPTRRRSTKTDDAGKAEAEAPNATVLDAGNAADATGAPSEATSSVEAKPADAGASPSDEQPSKDDALKAAMLFGQKHGDDALKAKIEAMGATKFSEIPAEKYADFMSILSAPASILD